LSRGANVLERLPFLQHAPEIKVLLSTADGGRAVEGCLSCDEIAAARLGSLPLSPIDWRLNFDGDSISVSPSVGNWSLPCRSHYVIDRSHVRWAGDWTYEQIEGGRSLERRRKKARHAPRVTTPTKDPELVRTNTDERAVAPRRTGLLTSARRWIAEIAKRW